MEFTDDLKEVWKKEKAKLDAIDPKENKELYALQLSRVNEIEKRLTEYAKTELEVEEKAVGRDMDETYKQKQLEQERKAQKHRNIIEIAKLTAAVGLGVAAMIWEKTDVMTSTTGKSTWKDVIKFKL